MVTESQAPTQSGTTADGDPCRSCNHTAWDCELDLSPYCAASPRRRRLREGQWKLFIFFARQARAPSESALLIQVSGRLRRTSISRSPIISNFSKQHCGYIRREKSGLLRVSAYILPAASDGASRDRRRPCGLGETQLTQAVTVLY